ncbi:MAG: ArsR/SmtB family transcription factor [Pseudomonadota bacterium]
MPSRAILARELSAMLKVIAHPDRVRLIEELKGGALDVSALSERLDLPATRISQHLGLLKAHRILEERRDGRFHHYSLAERDLANWLLDGVRFLEHRAQSDIAAQRVIEAAERLWRAGESKVRAGEPYDSGEPA